MSSKVSQFPKTYSASVGWKLFLAGLGLPLAIGGMAGSWYFGTGHEVATDTGMYILVGISLAMAALGLYCAIAPLISTILVLDEAALHLPGLFRERVLLKSEVSGYRTYMQQGINVLQLEFRTPEGKTKRESVTMLFKPDDIFVAWFDDIPNIDSVQMAESLQEVQMDERLGGSPQERLRSVSNARKIGHALTIISYLIAGWAVFSPRPYTLVFLALTSLPLIVLALCWRYSGSFSIDDTGKNTARADLTAIFIMPGFILAMRALSDVQLVDATRLVVPTLLALSVVILGVVWIAPIYRHKLGKLVVVSALMSAYTASAVAIANSLFDNAPFEQHVLPVLGKRHTTGKGASQYLRIPPWNSDVEVNEVQVSRDFYQHTEVGQTICLSLYPGVFGLHWYLAESVSVCRR